jgi:hypothetical protein
LSASSKTWTVTDGDDFDDDVGWSMLFDM